MQKNTKIKIKENKKTSQDNDKKKICLNDCNICTNCIYKDNQ
jgi:hypothetical protein